jgi:hypothetical protein
MPRWEISIIDLKKNGKTQYKVTRRMPSMSVAETKVFDTKEGAIKQAEEWMS